MRISYEITCPWCGHVCQERRELPDEEVLGKRTFDAILEHIGSHNEVMRDNVTGEMAKHVNQEHRFSATDPCGGPCAFGDECTQCSDYWCRMIGEGMFDPKSRTWTEKGIRERCK